MTFELTASVSLPIVFWFFLVVLSQSCLFVIVIYLVVRVNKNSNKRIERIVEEGNKKSEEDNRNLRMGIKDDFTNLRILMFQDYKRDAEEKDRKLDIIKTIYAQACEYLKSVATEFLARMEERWRIEEQGSIGKQPKIDGRKSLRRGLEIQKDFTIEYELTHKNTKSSLKKGEPDIVNFSEDGKVLEVVAVKSFDLEITEKGKTCRNVKGHKYAVSINPSRDAIAEVETARQNGLSKIRLVVFNLRTNHKIFDAFVLLNKKIKIRERV